MATISSPGIGSGLDVNSIITQLMAIERQPKDKLVSDATKIQSQISEVGKITSAISKLRDLSSKLSGTTFWNQTKAGSADPSVGVATTSNALAANYSVEVSKLASGQSVIAGQVFSSSSAAVGTGTLNIDMGTWTTSSSFTATGASTSTSISVDSTDTVATLRDKINAAGIGISASILTDANGARLVMRSTSTGIANAFKVSVSGGTGGLTTLAYETANDTTNTSSATRTKTASNAAATVDGVAVSSTTNTFADVLDGVTLTANAVTSSAVAVVVSSDTDSIKKTLQDFATAYSDLNKLIATDTRYDAAAKKGGPLQGDSAVIGVQSRMRSLLGATSSASSTYSRLSDAGFELQRDGSLNVNATRLDGALANLSQLKALFVNNASNTSSGEGFGQQFYDTTYAMTTVDGTLTSRADGLNAKLKRNQQSQDDQDERLTRTQARLQKQYSALDAQLGSLNSLSSYVSQQVAQWNKGG
jgi:flagellar hook-associated protein 2